MRPSAAMALGPGDASYPWVRRRSDRSYSGCASITRLASDSCGATVVGVPTSRGAPSSVRGPAPRCSIRPWNQAPVPVGSLPNRPMRTSALTLPSPPRGEGSYLGGRRIADVQHLGQAAAGVLVNPGRIGKLCYASGREARDVSHGQLRRHRHRRRDLRDVPAPPAARARPARAGVRGRRRRGRHLVLEPLPRGALRLRELDLRLLLLRGDPARVGVERALRGPAGDPALLQLRRRQARPAPGHRVRLPDPGRGLRRGRRTSGRSRARTAGARAPGS